MNNNKTRRSLLKAGAGLALAPSLIGVSNAQSRLNTKIDLSTPEARYKAHMKIVGTLDTETVYNWFDGELWGMMPNKEPAIICGFHGLARSNWIAQNDGSMKQHSFDVGFFSDLKTGEPASAIRNPFTGEMVEPFHYQYGGFEQHHKPRNDVYKENDGHWSILGDEISLREFGTRTVEHPIPMNEWPRESAGENYHAASETNYYSPVSQIADTNINNAAQKFFWTAVLSWEPWLLMDGAPGFVMWRGTGRKLNSYQEAPEVIKNYIKKVQPNYFDEGNPWTGIMSSIGEFKKKRKPMPK